MEEGRERVDRCCSSEAGEGLDGLSIFVACSSGWSLKSNGYQKTVFVFDRGGLVISPPLSKSRLLRLGDWCRRSDRRISWNPRSETKRNNICMNMFIVEAFRIRKSARLKMAEAE